MRRFITPALSALALLAACQQAEPPASDIPAPQAAEPSPDSTAAETPAVTNETLHALAEGNNRFAWSLFGALEGEASNVFVSPASVTGAFGLLYPGAAGETEAQMARLFGFDAVSPADFPAAEKALADAIVTDTETAKMTVANAVWLRQTSVLKAPYRSAVEGVMAAKVALVDFTKPAAAAKLINDWVEDHTNDRIKDLIPPSAIRPDATEMILTNAVWFKADWQSQFKKDATEDMPFHAPAGEVRAKMMQQTLKRARYLSRDGYAALDMDYSGGDYALTVILPDEGNALPRIAGAMTPEAFVTLIGDMDSAGEKRVRVFLPKVKIEANYELNDAMIALGLGHAFTSDADFSGLIEGAGPGDLVISKVLHKTFLEIDEKGTEAAAATAILMERAMAMPPQEEPVIFRADHPFLIALRHKPTGTVMFLGRVEDPTAG